MVKKACHPWYFCVHYSCTGAPDTTLFELGSISANLKFHQDSLLFMEKVRTEVTRCRYKIRQFAKRKHDGTIPIAGFSALFCKTSERDYARTLARLVYFMVKKQPVMSKRLIDTIDQGLESEHPQRRYAVQDLLFEALCEVGSGTGFTLELFVELFYVVAPNGLINRSGEFVQHVAAHILYFIRGAYILKCADNLEIAYDAVLQETWSVQYLGEQKDNAMSAVQGIKRIAAANIEDLDCKIVWLDDDTRLEVQTSRGSIPISILDLRSMYQDFIRRSEAFFEDMHVHIMNEQEIEQAVDFGSKTQGDGIMSMNSSIFAARINHSTTLNNDAASDDLKKEFCKKSYELGKLLVLALYLSGGPSARLTEISSWLVANSSQSSMRNLRFLRKLIAVVNSYSKSENYGAGSDKHVVCFADKKLSALVMTYLIHVKRLEHEYVGMYRGERARRNSLLSFLVHKGEVVDGVMLGKIFRNEFLGHGLDVSISDMRHVLEAFARKIGCLYNESETNVLLEFANHTATTSNKGYAKSNLDLPGIAADIMQQCFFHCKRWNKLILDSDMSSGDQDVQSGGEGASALNLVAAAMPDPILQIAVAHSQPITQLAQISSQHHMSVNSFGKRQRESLLEDALQALGIENLKSLQMKAYVHLQNHQDSHSFIVLPTGSGKSKLVFVDALVRGVCNVLFVPYVAISEGVLAEGDHGGKLRVVSWPSVRDDFHSAANSAHIVVASFEHAGTGMVGFFQRLQALGRLGHCFLDEADVLLESFRQLNDFWMLSAACPLVKVKAMTATLRPTEQPRLAMMTGIGDQQVSVLREPCMRDDIEIKCQYFANESMVMVGVEAWIRSLPTSARIIVFTMTVREAEVLGALLAASLGEDVSISHAARKDKLGRIAVVTSCFAHGINIVGLTHVGIVSCSWSCESLVQAMGRLRQPGICSIFTSLAGLRNIVWSRSNVFSQKTKEAAQLLIDNQSGQTLKSALAKLLDTPISCGAVVPNTQFSPVRFKEWQYHCQSLQLQIAQLAVGNHCMYCLVMKKEGADKHGNRECPETKGMCNKCYTPGHNRYQV
jgi:hypothetical protein